MPIANCSLKKILITGASGFVGSFLVERALAEGMEVWAAVRASSSRAYLSDARIRFVLLELDKPGVLEAQLRQHLDETGRAWDYVLHAAGVTQCRRREDFFRVNTEGTLALASALLRTKALAGRFVFVSSLSVMGALREKAVGNGKYAYTPMLDGDLPQPNTAYGESKLRAERGLAALAEKEGLDYVVLRPTGVYGPRERDYFLMAKSIAGGVDFSAGFKRQEITFIYVLDLVEACFLALERGKSGSAYFLTDGGVYESSAFSDLLQKELGKKHLLRITAPLCLLRLVCFLSETLARLRGSSATLNTDKCRILSQRNWQCDISKARRELGYAPKWTLTEGVKASVAWYKKEKWL